MESVIEVQNLSKTYADGTQALNRPTLGGWQSRPRRHKRPAWTASRWT
jgi:hypothetical protein